MNDHNVGDIVRTKTLPELIRTGWTIKNNYLIPPYWKEDCGLQANSVIIGQEVKIVRRIEDSTLEYEVQSISYRGFAWVPGSIFKT